MTLDPRIPLMGRPIQLNSPLNMLARAQGIQNMQQTNALNAMQMQDAQAQRMQQQQQAQQQAQARANFPDPPDDAPEQLKFAVRAFKAGLGPFSGITDAMKPEREEYLSAAPGSSVVNRRTGQITASIPQQAPKVDPNKPFMPGPDGVAIPNLPYQAYERSLRAKGGAGGSSEGGGETVVKPGVTGAALLDALSEDDAITVQGLADGTVKPSEISSKGNRRERMLALAKRFDPTANWGPSGKMKEVPVAVQKALLENDTNLRRALRAQRLVGGGDAALNPVQPGEATDPNATGFKGYLPNQVLNRVDPAGVDARAAIADLGSLVIHDRSGAAVTAAEFPRLAPFIPSEKDDAATVRKKLAAFVRVYREEMAAMQGSYSADNGYKDFKVGGSAAQSGPVQVQTMQEAQKLPTGTVFIDPNGVRRVR